MTVTELVSIGGLLIALIGAGIAAWAAVVSARRQADAVLEAARHQTKVYQELTIVQIRATSVLARRQQWVETLRVELADLISEMVTVQAIVKGSLQADESSATDRLKRMIHLVAGVSLLLDREQPLHRELMDALGKSGEFFIAPEREDFGEVVNQIITLGTRVLKAEADRLHSLAGISQDQAVAGNPSTFVTGNQR